MGNNVVTENPLVGEPTSRESSLSEWAGPYVTNMLGQGQALANMPYEAYGGPLTAGSSDLQNQAFSGLANLAVPMGTQTLPGFNQNTTTAGSFNPFATDTNTFGANQFGTNQTGTRTFGANQFGTNNVGNKSFTDQGVAGQYMNPYLQQALDPQLREASKQAGMSRMADAARLSQAGAFGGSRQAIMESEGSRNMLNNMADITGRGYSQAYQQASSLFGQEEGARREQANLNEQRRLGQLNTDEARRLQQLESGENRRLNQFNTGEDRRLGQLNTDEERRLGQFNVGENARRSQFNIESDRNQRNIQDDRRYGLDAIQAQLQGGATQRGIEQEGVAADMAQYEAERMNPYQNIQFMQSLLQGLPIATAQMGYAGPSDAQEMAGGADWLREFLQGMQGTQTTQGGGDNA